MKRFRSCDPGFRPYFRACHAVLKGGVAVEDDKLVPVNAGGVIRLWAMNANAFDYEGMEFHFRHGDMTLREFGVYRAFSEVGAALCIGVGPKEARYAQEVVRGAKYMFKNPALRERLPSVPEHLEVPQIDPRISTLKVPDFNPRTCVPVSFQVVRVLRYSARQREAHRVRCQVFADMPDRPRAEAVELAPAWILQIADAKVLDALALASALEENQ